MSFATAEGVDEGKASFALLLLKKQYLDDREEEDGLWKMDNGQINALKDQISASINFNS